MKKLTLYFAATLTLLMVVSVPTLAPGVVTPSMVQTADGTDPIPEPIMIPPAKSGQEAGSLLLADGTDPIPEPIMIPPVRVTVDLSA